MVDHRLLLWGLLVLSWCTFPQFSNAGLHRFSSTPVASSPSECDCCTAENEKSPRREKDCSECPACPSFSFFSALLPVKPPLTAFNTDFPPSRFSQAFRVLEGICFSLFRPPRSF